MDLAVQKPWLHVVPARIFLRYLAELTPFLDPELPAEQLAQWLKWHGLGPLAHRHCKKDWPQLAALLRVDLYKAIARNGVHFTHLQAIIEQFSSQIPVVLLKGAALAEDVYGGQAFRTMSDLDLWVPHDHIEQAIEQMLEAGFSPHSKEKRPLSLQMLANGEIRFYRTAWQTPSLVELHLSPFAGWWLVHTAAIDHEAIWQRLEPVASCPEAKQLDPADTIIHLAVHTAVNHQFDFAFTRSLLDMTLTAQKRNVDWQAVAQRAKAWRVATVLYFVLDLLNTIMGLPELEPILATLRPSAWQRYLFNRIVKPEKALNGSDSFAGSLRFLILLLLVDRSRDRLKLIWRTLWPTNAWLEARYGKPVTHLEHLWYVIRQRGV